MKTLSKTKTYEYVSKTFIIIINLFLLSQSGFAQNVGIGTTTPQGEFHVSRPYDWQGVTFSGSGVDDITVYHDNYTGTTERTYIIKVSNASNDPDLFDWSDDNGSSWHTYYQMSTSPVPLDYGISVSWSSANGHTDNDQWSFTIGPSYPDGLIVKLGQVGMGTDSPASCAKLDINSSSMGVLVPRTDTTTVNISNPGGSLSAGLLIYQNGDNTFYYYDGSKWTAITKGQDVVFERNNTTVRQKGHYDIDDFIFGRNALPQNGESVTDSMFFFDKSKAAFRAGQLTTSQNWSPDNMGLASFAFGKNTKASGDYSTAMGENTTASGVNATAMGTTTTASGEYSTTMGDSTTASGYNSTAMGYYTTAPSGYETVLGRYNTGYTPNSTNGWNDDDRLFVIGNGSSSSHSNALTILKNGNTGINEENPASLLSVNGAGASDKTLASYNNNGMGTAVYGKAAATTYAMNYGGYFEAQGDQGYGVYGLASSTDDMNPHYGGYFEANGDLGTGVYGNASGGSGVGIYGVATAIGSVTNYGGSFSSQGDNGMGIYSEAAGSSGRGVYGYASGTSGKNYGVFGKSSSSDGYGGYFEGRGYFSDDFMVGTDSLPQNGESVTDTMLFFDKSKAAFRTGDLDHSTRWAPENMGFGSFAFGYNTKASGDYSTAMGYNTTASNAYATAMGWSTTASGEVSTAMGVSTTANGDYSIAMGRNTTAPSGYEIVLGRYNTDYTPISTTGWNDNDRLFVIGNGSSSYFSNNALTMLKNGNIGINEENPVSLLSVNGTGSSDKTLASYNSEATGTAVYGYASSTSSSRHYGGYFKAEGSIGYGVYGEASNSTGVNYGGYFKTESSSGIAVRGYANNAIGTNYGGYFTTQSSSGTAVRGLANNTSGTNYGGKFEAKGSGGYGVYGYASSTSSSNHYGGYFKAEGSTGYGVYGEASNLTGFNYGGYFETASSSGCGVRGWAINTSGTNYGGYFTTQSSSGTAVRGLANNTSGTNYGGEFKAEGDNGTGVVGYGKAYDFDATGPGVNYGATSSIRWKKNIVEIPDPIKKIKRLRGVYFDWDAAHGGQHDIGCIAEEVGKVLPEIVVYEKNGIDAKGMDYSKLTPLLIEAIKAQQTTIQEQQKEIQSLKKQNAEILKRLEALESK